MAPEPLDWRALHLRFLRELTRHLRVEEETRRDLAQECCVRLLRASRKHRAEELPAMVPVIARRTAMDHLRREYRRQHLLLEFESEAPEASVAESIDPKRGDLFERMEFLVLEFFHREDRPECRELAGSWFGERSWAELAEGTELSATAIRKRWSRCVAVLREAIQRDERLKPLLDWSRR